MNKKAFKKLHKKCLICEETDYSVLDVHRIQFGGQYNSMNCIVLCALCHRKVHDEQIVIDKKYQSTSGKIVHYYIKDQEYWKLE